MARAITEAETENQEAKRQEVIFDYDLLPWQSKARHLLEKYQILVVNAGVFTGKTTWGAATLLEDMCLNPGKLFWWVAGLDWQIKRFWEDFKPAAIRLGAQARDMPHCYAKLPNGSRVYGVSAKSIDSIASYHPFKIYGDEVSKMNVHAWNMIRIRMIKSNRGILLSTPRANHWQQLISWGKEHRHGKWAVINATTEEAGIATKNDIEEAKKDLPWDLFRQEFLAEIVAGAGQVFPKVEACIKCSPKQAEKNKRYLITYDPAKLHDFAVATVWDGYDVAWCERWQKADYMFQAKAVVDLSQRYNCSPIIMDSTGPGEPVKEMVFEEIRSRSISVFMTGVVFDNLNKTAMVNEAIMKFEREEFGLIDSKHGYPYNTFIEELLSFEKNRSRSGLSYTYSAPEGMHDDCVSSLLLRMAGLNEPRVSFFKSKTMEEKIKEIGKSGKSESKEKQKESGGPHISFG